METRNLMTGRAGLVLALAASALLAGPASADDKAPGENRSPATAIDDATVTTNVKTKLIADTDTKAYQIDVSTSNGVVQLNGFVDNATAKSEAERLALASTGVKKVENNLEVRSKDRPAGSMVDDATLTAKVDAALLADKRTSAMRIGVESRGGEVQLSGFAGSANEKSAAESVAKGVEGVKTVTNNIDVR